MRREALSKFEPVIRGAALVCALMLLLPVLSQSSNAAAIPADLPLLTTAEQVHQLTRESAALGRRAVIRGVVTCFLPDVRAVVLQDATRGIYIDQLALEPGEPIPELGQILEIEGVTDPGEFAPQLHARRIKRLGMGELPRPVQPTWDQLINGSLDTQFVEIDGVITAVRADSVMLLTHGGKLRLRIFGTNGVALTNLEDSRVRLRGCLFATWDAQTHRVRVGEISVFVTSFQIDEPTPADVFALPCKRAPDLKLFDPQASALRRVLVAGQIVHEQDGEYFVMDGTNGFRFTPKATTVFEPGDFVEVAGFPGLTGPSPLLREAVARKTGWAELPEALFLDPESFFQAGFDARRVRMVGVLQSLSGDQRTLELQSGLVRFLARLEGLSRAPRATQGRPPENLGLPVGSLLELTGVYAGRGGNPTAGGEIGSFELLLNSPADIIVLARPPFWTLSRLLILVGTLATVLLLALFWIRLLHHKVQARTAQLQIEVREREHAEQQRALAMERSRIARDLHDDLGSSLTEITLLATAGPGQKVTAEESSERLQSIAGKSRTMVHALDEIVWAVDPQRDTLSSVARYLASYTEEYLAGLKVGCRVQIPHSFPERVVSGEARHELFLAVKEALNNAVRHGHATEVGFSMRLSMDEIEFMISDNGGGFDLSHHQNGHGLPNLHARLENLRGQCQIQSSPGKGTTVSLRLALDSPTSKS